MTDDEKALVSAQLSALSEECRGAIASVKQTNAELTAQTAVRAAEQQGVLRELAIWRIVCRYGFALILGSSLFGLVYVRSYVADIAQQQLQTYTRRTDQLVFGVSAGVKEDWQTALNEFSASWRTVPANASSESRQYTMRNLLWALGSIEQESTDGTWMGSEDWADLSSNDFFKRTLKNDPGWAQDGDVNFNVGLAIMKFDRGDGFVDRSMRYLQVAATYRVPEERKAQVHYYLAVLALISRNDSLARDEMGKAAMLNPRIFAIARLSDESEPFLSPAGFEFWRSIGAAAHHEKFDERLRTFLYRDLKTSSKTAG